MLKYCIYVGKKGLLFCEGARNMQYAFDWKILLRRINDLMHRLAPPGPNLVSSKTPRSAPHTTAISETGAFFSTTSILTASPLLKNRIGIGRLGGVSLCTSAAESLRKPMCCFLLWKWDIDSYHRRRSAATGSTTREESWRKWRLRKKFSPRCEERTSCTSVPPCCPVQRTFQHQQNDLAPLIRDSRLWGQIQLSIYYVTFICSFTPEYNVPPLEPAETVPRIAAPWQAWNIL